MYTFFVFSKIDKNTVFTVSVHDQNTVSLPKLLNEAKIGKISHCVMRWGSLSKILKYEVMKNVYLGCTYSLY